MVCWEIKAINEQIFSRLNSFEFVVRNNWALHTHTNLCAPTGSHATPEESLKIHPLFPAELDFNKCFFRVEKQSFTRLPDTGTNVMFIRTYMTSLMSLRDEMRWVLSKKLSYVARLTGSPEILRYTRKEFTGARQLRDFSGRKWWFTTCSKRV